MSTPLVSATQVEAKRRAKAAARFRAKYPGLELVVIEELVRDPVSRRTKVQARTVAVWTGEGSPPEWMRRELGTKGEREGTAAW